MSGERLTVLPVGVTEQTAMAYRMMKARFVADIQKFVILDRAYDRPEMFFVAGILIIIFIRKTVVIIESIRRIKRFNVRKKNMNVRNFPGALGGRIV